MDEYITAKQIRLYIPSNNDLPVGYDEWTPEETSMILSIGSIALKQAKLGLGPLNYSTAVKELALEYEKRYEESVRVLQERAEKAEKDVQSHNDKLRLMEEYEETQIQRRLKQSKEVFDQMLESYRKERRICRCVFRNWNVKMRRRVNRFDILSKILKCGHIKRL